jgi:tetratricopeptide (TPR) repeat protein
LERRVKNDPASIAFAQLAEEYRRAGRFDDAARVARDGLRRHPAYLSARVTLGRALIELKHYRDARTELEAVIREAPDNLLAIRALADLHQHGDDDEDAATPPPIALSPADLDLALTHPDEELTRALHAIDALDLRGVGRSVGSAPDSFEPSEFDIPDSVLDAGFADGRSSFAPDASLDFVDELQADPGPGDVVTPERFTMWPPDVPAEPPSRHELDGTAHLLEPPALREPDDDPGLDALESWLEAITIDRASRS